MTNQTRPTKTNATRFQYETASASDTNDAALARDFLLFLGWTPDQIDAAAIEAARAAIERSRA